MSPGIKISGWKAERGGCQGWGQRAWAGSGCSPPGPARRVAGDHAASSWDLDKDQGMPPVPQGTVAQGQALALRAEGWAVGAVCSVIKRN